MNGTGLSDDFKDLILRLFSYEGDERPNVEAIRNHPWMQSATFDMEATRAQLLQKLAQKTQSKAASEPATKPVKVKRSAAMV